MAETYGFFDSENHDRPYTSTQMSQYFQGIVTNGVFDGIGKNLVPYINGPYVKIPPGRAVVDCHWYNNDDTVALNFPITSASVRCILVLTCDYIQRRIYPEIKQGTSVNLPEITDTENIKYLKLANLQISSSTATVTKVCIGDETPLLKNLTEYVVKEDGKSLSTNDFTDAYKSQVDTNKSDISELKSKTDAANTNISNLSAEVKGKANSSDVYTKSETDSKITSKVSEIVAGAPEDFDTLKEMSDWLKGHESSAAAMNTAIIKNSDDISDVEDEIQLQKSALSEQSTAIEQNKSSITGLDVRLTQAEDKITKNILKIDENTAEITALKAEDKRLLNNIQAAYKDIDTNAENISALGERVTANENAVTTQNAVNADHIQRIKDNASGITINQTTLGYQKKNIMKLSYSPGYSYTNNGKTVTWTFNNDYSVSMTAIKTITSGVSYEYSRVTLQPGKYIYSVEGYSTPNITHTQLYSINADGTSSWLANYSAPENTITVTEETTYSFRAYRNAAVTVGVTETFFPMIRCADITDDTFEPYIDDVDTRLNAVETTVGEINGELGAMSRNIGAAFDELDAFEIQSQLYSNTTGGSSPLTVTVSNLFTDYSAVICNITTSSGNYSLVLPLAYIRSLGTSAYYTAESLLFYYVDDSRMTIRTGLGQSNPTISNVKIIGLY